MQLHSFAFSNPSENSSTQTWVNETKNVFFTFALYGASARSDAEKIVSILQSPCDSPEEFIALFNTIQDLSSPGDEIVSLWRKDGQIVTAVKNGKIWLKRGSKVGVLIQGLEESKIIQGKLQDQDLFVLLNAQASKELDEYLSEVLPSASDPELLNTLLMSQAQEFEQIAVAGMIVTSSSDQENFPIEPQNEKISTKGPVIGTNILKSLSLKGGLFWRRFREKNAKIFRLVFLLVIIIVVVIGIIWGMKKIELRNTQQFISSFEVKLQQIQEQANSDKLLARDQSLQLLKEWEAENEAKNFRGASKELSDAFQQKIQETYGTLSGRTEYSVLPTFYDFRLVRSDFIATYSDLDGNLAQFLDPSKSVLIQLNLDNKQQLVLPIGEYETLKDISFTQEKVYLLSNGLFEFQIDSKNDAVKILNEDEENKNAKYLGAFENFLYVFNAEKRNIFRYNLDDTENSTTAIGWIQDKKDLDFDQVHSMTIDGNIWLGTNTGQIFRYERGTKVEFVPKGVEKDFSSPIKIFTKPDFTHIYVLEPSQKRVVVLLKDGTYVKEFVHSSLEAGSDIIAREETNSIYVVSGSLLYEMKY